ncbi:hypothetical protein Y710_16560 [Gordonia sp. QH-12]|uniref:hypothetical protein n=1 Tax=Gordonia sp. QH-12 TaxID=1437876 RepID=UPI000782518B|nr:hypothetical protein [Gordonia sp. QH-12]KXT55951.1 hypothetical protein Y710_16560 [Gordonia sp. QH-12]
MTEPDAATTTLTLDQQQRAEALDRARGVLTTRSGLVGSTGPDAMDLVNVATYIVTGDDPWPPTTDATATRTTEGDHQ